MKKFITIFVFVLCYSAAVHAQAASDVASNYGGIWGSSDNGGNGFLGWNVTSNNGGGLYAGTFIGSSTDGAGNINTSGVSFGLYANPSGAFVNASRSFIAALGVTNIFTFRMALNYDNGNKGFNLISGTLGEVFNFNVGTGASVSSANATLTPGSGAGYNYGGNDAVIDVTITMLSTSSFQYSISRTSSQGFQGVLFSGTVTGATQSITGFQFYVAGTDAGGAAQNNLYFNHLSVSGDPLPVELTSFNATIRNGFVDLKWETATEVNNHGFEVERKSVTSDWSKIGFVDGHGTSNSPKFYKYSDKPSGTGKFSYRLKQIDNDGQFEYSPVVEVLVDNLPNGFVLEQNYPNPFNPETSIRFALKEDTKASLKVFNAMGEEVTTLFDGIAEAGRYYDVKFSGNDLSSGFYIYKLVAGEYVSVKKMLLMK